MVALGPRSLGDELDQIERRQAYGAGVGPESNGYPDCRNVGNDVLTCYPTSNTTLVQDSYSIIEWNRNNPLFIAASRISIYVYDAQTGQQLTSFTNLANTRGQVAFAVNDTFLPRPQTTWAGSNITRPYYVVAATGTTLNGGEAHQATFTVIQTAPPATLAAALASSSAASAASVSAAAVAASISGAIVSATATVTSLDSSVLSSLVSRFGSSAVTAAGIPIGTNTSSPRPQTASNDSDGGFPTWAIAVISTLGGLLLLLALIGAYLILARMRRRRDAMQEPIMRQRDGDDAMASGGIDSSSPFIIGAALASAGASARASTPVADERGSLLGNASPTLDQQPMLNPKRSEATISTTEAAHMAEAFRKTLRQPVFRPADQSPSSSNEGGDHRPTTGDTTTSTAPPIVDPTRRQSDPLLLQPDATELMERELRSEGMAMQTVPDHHRVDAEI